MLAAGYIVVVSKQSTTGPVLTSQVYNVSNGTLNVLTQIDGFVTINVSAVDVAGNVDPRPVSMSIVVLSTLPDATLTTPPPALTNSSTLAFVVASLNIDVALLLGFSVSTTPAIPGMASVYHVDAGVANVTVRLTNVPSGVYTAEIHALDVLGNSGQSAVTTFTVDTDAPTSRFLSQPPAYVAVNVLDVTVRAVDVLSAVTLAVRVDGGDWSPVQSSDDAGVDLTFEVLRVHLFCKLGISLTFVLVHPASRCVVVTWIELCTLCGLCRPSSRI